MLDSKSRPVELPHPDTEKTIDPHEYKTYDFLLSWHDLFHAWRSGSNFKALILKLMEIHDEKAGLNEDYSGMSKAIWSLADMDFSAGQTIRNTSTLPEDKQKIISRMELILRSAGFNFSIASDDNILLTYYLSKNPDMWSLLFPGQSQGEFLNILLKDKDSNQNIINLCKKEWAASQYLNQYPDATVISLILHDLLSPGDNNDAALLNRLKYAKNNIKQSESVIDQIQKKISIIVSAADNASKEHPITPLNTVRI